MARLSLSLRLCVIVISVFTVPLKVIGNSEGGALYSLRRSLLDPDNVLQSWDPNLVNPCTWFHITCNQANRVTRVDLGNSNLSGHLIPELGKLEHLQYLELYKNNIQGTIPVELGNLKSLISLDLYNNNISGIIPPALGKLESLVFLTRVPTEMRDGATRADELRRRLTEADEGSTRQTEADEGWRKMKELRRRLEEADEGWRSFDAETMATEEGQRRLRTMKQSFENNPRLEGPELQGLASYDTNCS